MIPWQSAPLDGHGRRGVGEPSVIGDDHGFHFKRKRALVVSLVDRVLYATAVLRVPDAIARITRPSERMHALLRAEMDRLSADPRHFRLLLDYWTIGVRNARIRQKVRAALEQYRAGFSDLADAIVSGELRPSSPATSVTRWGRADGDGCGSGGGGGESRSRVLASGCHRPQWVQCRAALRCRRADARRTRE